MTPGENLRRAVRFDKPEWIPMTFHIAGACWNHYDQDGLPRGPGDAGGTYAVAGAVPHIYQTQRAALDAARTRSGLYSAHAL